MADLIGSLEQDALTGLFNFWTSKVSDDLSRLVSKPVTITGGSWKVVQPGTLKEQYPLPRLIGTIEMENHEPYYVLMMTKDAAVIVDLFMGGDGTGVQEDFNEVQLNILEEMMNQMGGALASILSQFTGKTHKCLLPKVQMNGMTTLPPQLLSLTYQMKVKDLMSGPFIVLVGMHHALDLGNTLVNLKPTAPAAEQPPQAAAARAQATQQAQAPARQQQAQAPPQPRAQEEREVRAQPAQLSQLTSQAPGQKVGNLDLIFDVLLQLTAVLGRTGITIKDLVELGPGSVLELDKLVGEAVELYANNKLVAKGEVVVIDERFAIRVTETVTPAERLQGLKG